MKFHKILMVSFTFFAYASLHSAQPAPVNNRQGISMTVWHCLTCCCMVSLLGNDVVQSGLKQPVLKYDECVHPQPLHIRVAPYYIGSVKLPLANPHNELRQRVGKKR